MHPGESEHQKGCSKHAGPEHPLANAFGVDMDERGNYKALLAVVFGRILDLLGPASFMIFTGPCNRKQASYPRVEKNSIRP